MKIKIKPAAPGQFIPVKKENQAPVQQPVKREETLIRKCIGIIIDDINYKFRGIKSKERLEWEENRKIYESFYKMAKGDK